MNTPLTTDLAIEMTASYRERFELLVKQGMRVDYPGKAGEGQGQPAWSRRVGYALDGLYRLVNRIETELPPTVKNIHAHADAVNLFNYYKVFFTKDNEVTQ